MSVELNVAARPLTAADIPAVADLVSRVYDELGPLRGGALLLAQQGRRLPCGESLAADLADPSTMLFVGTIDDAALGWACAETRELADGSRLGVVREIGVLAEARGVGIGEELLGLAVAWCRANRCRGIDSFALPGARETKNFFETFGFTARLLVVHTSLVEAVDEPVDDPIGDPVAS